jgi:hypothetical protein
VGFDSPEHVVSPDGRHVYFGDLLTVLAFRFARPVCGDQSSPVAAHAPLVPILE